jgi:hypothetical protein
MYGGSDTYDALLYGANRHPGTVSYLQNQLNTLSNLSSSFIDAGNSFVERAKEVYNRFNSSEAIRTARAAIRKLGSMFQSNEIMDIWDLGNFQNAPLICQRFIMAEPSVRELYHKQRIDGYSDTYLDVQPGKIGKDHYDYRRAMNGIVEELPEDSESGWKVTIWAEDLHEGDRDLTLDEQHDVQMLWQRVRAYMKHGKDDPTSAYGGTL